MMGLGAEFTLKSNSELASPQAADGAAPISVVPGVFGNGDESLAFRPASSSDKHQMDGTIKNGDTTEIDNNAAIDNVLSNETYVFQDAVLRSVFGTSRSRGYSATTHAQQNAEPAIERKYTHISVGRQQDTMSAAPTFDQPHDGDAHGDSGVSAGAFRSNGPNSRHHRGRHGHSHPTPRDAGSGYGGGGGYTGGSGDWEVFVAGGTQLEPQRVIASESAGFSVRLSGNANNAQVVSIEWTIPDFPAVFGHYDVANEQNEPATPEPESYGRVSHCDVPQATDKRFEFSCFWGPVDKDVSVIATVKIDRGNGNIESRTGKAFFNIDEPELVSGTVNHNHNAPFITSFANCHTLQTLVAFGCVNTEEPENEAGFDARPVVRSVDEYGNTILAGFLFFIQLADYKATLTYFDGVQAERNTQGYRLDQPPPFVGYQLQQDDGSHYNKAVIAGVMCPTNTNVTNDDPPQAYCQMDDSPSIKTKTLDDVARIEWTFHAETTLMFTVGGIGDSVPVARVKWWFKVTAIRDPANQDKWITVPAETDHGEPGSMTAIDDWPVWGKNVDDFQFALKP